MKKAVILLVVLLVSSPVFAATSTGKANYVVPNNQAFEDFLNDQDCIQHSHDIEKPKKFQKEVGLDFLIYENKTIQVVSENRFNLTSKVTTSTAVVKVNKSLFSIIKGLFK